MIACFPEDARAIYRIDHLHNKVTNGSFARQRSQIKPRLIYPILCGEIGHSAASDFSSILWVKCCLGNSEKKAGSWGWSGVRETVKRLLNYSLLSVKSTEWENCPKEKKREAQEATDSWLGWFVLLVYTAWSHKPPLSMKYTWTKPIIAPCHAQSHEIGVLKLLYAAFQLTVFLCSAPKLSVSFFPD